jgi:hypothetical protein
MSFIFSFRVVISFCQTLRLKSGNLSLKCIRSMKMQLLRLSHELFVTLGEFVLKHLDLNSNKLAV